MNFKEIIPIYDMMNNIISFSLHNHWRSLCVKMAEFPPHSKILDIGCGTGDFSLEIQRHVKNTYVFGMDILEDMIKNALCKVNIIPIVGDATSIPFKNEVFDGITLGFVLRHIDIQSFLKEAMRVLKDDGKIIILDISLPKHFFIRFLFKIYLYRIIPFLGRLFKSNAYFYLGESLKKLPSISKIEDIAYKLGAKKVKRKNFIFGCLFLLLVNK